MNGASEGLALGMTAAWTVAAAFFAWYAASVAGEVTYVTLPDGRRRERSLPFLFKLVLPFAGNFDRLVACPSFASAVASADALLVSAGFEGILNGREFVALRLLLGWWPPLMWLHLARRRRHLEITKALPFVLDVLTLSVEAGLDFISALQRNCSARRLDALNEELLRMTKEIQLGSPRREALRRMADRTGQGDLRTLSHALIQADELGVSIGSILRIQADQMRERRFARAERLANEAPTKMLGPLLLFIFPAVFVILLGPVVLQFMKGAFL